MSASAGAEPAAQVRARSVKSGVVRIDSRTHGYLVEGQTQQAPDAANPSSLDYLLGALASDLIAGLEREARRAGAALDQVEASLSARLDNPLVALGVIGESGSARIAGIRGSVYVCGDVAEPALRECWEQALAKAPVYATLSQCIAVDVAMQFIL
jgi:hypothetical protein